MMYKAFAALTLVGAPIIVLLAQSLAPHSPGSAAPGSMMSAGTVQPSGRSAPAAQQAPMPVPPPTPTPIFNTPTPDPSQFGQPLPDAAKPFLSPGNGLPDRPQPPTPPGEAEGDGGLPPPAD